jgi:hypothetical protein
MRLLPATLLTTIALATPAVAQSDVARAGGAEFSGFKTYWAEQREGCQPMIAFTIRNGTSGDIGPVKVRMEVVDTDNKSSVFARGLASVPSADLAPGHARKIAIGGDRDITLHDCLGDMHEAPFSSINFVVRLTAEVARDPSPVELMRDQPMKNESMPAPN